MTNDDLTLLSQGRIPAAVVMPTILERLERLDSDRDPDAPGALTLLCENQDLNFGTVTKIIYRWKYPTCSDGALRSLDFDTADKLLCGLNLMDLWRGELADYYYSVDLTWRQCACPGCETMFRNPNEMPVVCVNCGESEKKIIARGLCAACYMHAKYHKILDNFPRLERKAGRAPKYCSDECREAAGRIERGESLSGVRKKPRADRCRNGHKRTRANTKYRPDGKIVCKVCLRESRKAVRQRNRQAVAA